MSPRKIVALGAALYAASLAVAWIIATGNAERDTWSYLDRAPGIYASTIDDEVMITLWYVGAIVLDSFSRDKRIDYTGDLSAIADTYHLDEVNVVGRDGVAIGSNMPEILGVDYHDDPRTAEYLVLTNGTGRFVCQRFRNGVSNPGLRCMYLGLAIPGSGGCFAQLGVSVDRLRHTYELLSPFKVEWKFGDTGRFDTDLLPSPMRMGRYVRETPAGREYCYGFGYECYAVTAVLPEAEFFSKRWRQFSGIALLLVVVFGVTVFFFVRLSIGSRKLEQLHAEAARRTATDLAVARTIQMSALPSASSMDIGLLEFSLDAFTCPAREVGGDFYDFYLIPGRKMALVVADASGKGIPAALFMMNAKNVLQACMQSFDDLAEAIAEANRRLCANNDAGMFVSVWAGIVEIDTGLVTFVNAGHNPPYVRHTDGSLSRISERGGRLLGLFDDASYHLGVLRLERGDRLFLYTDGVTEAMDSRRGLYGEKRLAKVLAAGGDELGRAVYDDVLDFAGGAEQSDDIAIVDYTWHGSPEDVAREFACAETSLGEAMEFLQGAIGLAETKARSRLLNAADEMLSNIVNYSGATAFRIGVANVPGRTRIEITDDGRPYDPLTHADPNTHVPLSERPLGGLGILMTKRLVDKFAYSRTDRNQLTIVKRG